MTGLFHHVFASGALLLLFATSTTLVHPAGAYSSELTDSPVTGYTTDGTTGATPSPATTSDTTGAVTLPPGATEEEEDDDGDSAEVCNAEQVACASEETCWSCLSAGSSSAAFASCGGELVDAAAATSAEAEEICADNVAVGCCLDELSEFECLENDAFVVTALCFLEASGCPADGIECVDTGDEDEDEDEDSTDVASDGATSATSLGNASTSVVAFSCAFMVLWPLLWV